MYSLGDKRQSHTYAVRIEVASPVPLEAGFPESQESVAVIGAWVCVAD